MSSEKIFETEVLERLSSTIMKTMGFKNFKQLPEDLVNKIFMSMYEWTKNMEEFEMYSFYNMKAQPYMFMAAFITARGLEFAEELSKYMD